ncbi:HVO_A0114 family putative DNA-binding protein [Vibrio spartinae]|uniref:MarR family protein n=1 Tax=Vibrio spartinae TaxID=1918945 RepID=A0A1N6M8T1_9VIBR|nr:MarR family transcriptional regulator [Vibrio spartinae]SIO95767.1 MarR family protein [Vibrio spartinae]
MYASSSPASFSAQGSICFAGDRAGEHVPQVDEPKVWYTSVNAVAQILRPENIALLRLIDTEKPASLTALARISGRAKSNLSNTLKTLSEKGFVRMEPLTGKILKPMAIYTDFEIISDSALEQKLLKLMADKPAA